MAEEPEPNVVPKEHVDRAKQIIEGDRMARRQREMTAEFRREVQAKRAEMLDGQQYNYQPKQFRPDPEPEPVEESANDGSADRNADTQRPARGNRR